MIGELRDAAERDLVRVWRALASGRQDPAAGVEEHDGLVLVSTGVDFPFFNGGFVLGGCRPDVAVEATRAFFAARRRPYLLRVPAERTDIIEAVQAAGMVDAPVLELMALRIPAAVPALPDGLVADPVDGAAALGRHAALLAASFEMPVEIMVGFLGDVPLRDDRFSAFNGLLDGEPAAASAVFTQDGVAGVYDVGTLPHRRSRGLAEAMTWHAVAQGAARGASIAVLQPSPMGRPLYERMGFTVVAQWRQFLDPPDRVDGERLKSSGVAQTRGVLEKPPNLWAETTHPR